MAANLVEAFKMQSDDWRQRGYQHLLPGTGVNLLHLLIYANKTKHTERSGLTVKTLTRFCSKRFEHRHYIHEYS